MTRRPLEPLTVHLNSLWLVSSKHKPPDPRRCTVDVSAPCAAGPTAGTQRRYSSLALPVGAWVSPERNSQAVCIIHQAAGIRCRSNLTVVFCARFIPGNRNTVGEQLWDVTGKRPVAKKPVSVLCLHRRQVDTRPTRRWWRNTGGLTSVCISRVVFRLCFSGRNVRLGLMFWVFLPQWLMEVRNPPPRGPTPPPRPLLSPLRLPSAL